MLIVVVWLDDSLTDDPPNIEVTVCMWPRKCKSIQIILNLVWYPSIMPVTRGHDIWVFEDWFCLQSGCRKYSLNYALPCKCRTIWHMISLCAAWSWYLCKIMEITIASFAVFSLMVLLVPSMVLMEKQFQSRILQFILSQQVASLCVVNQNCSSCRLARARRNRPDIHVCAISCVSSMLPVWKLPGSNLWNL